MLPVSAMYLREALRRCQDLEERAADLHATQAAAAGANGDGEFWQRRAETESRHARVLADLLRALEEAGDDGPFVVDLRGQIARLCEALDEAFAKQRAEDAEAHSPLYSTDFVLQSCDSLFERIVRIAELSSHDTASDR